MEQLKPQNMFKTGNERLMEGLVERTESEMFTPM